MSENFSKRVRDLQNTYTKETVLKAKLQEVSSEDQFESSLNNNIKLVKQMKMTGSKRVLLVQAISNSECYLVDDSKLSEVALTYLKSFMPKADDQADISLIHSMMD